MLFLIASRFLRKYLTSSQKIHALFPLFSDVSSHHSRFGLQGTPCIRKLVATMFNEKCILNSLSLRYSSYRGVEFCNLTNVRFKCLETKSHIPATMTITSMLLLLFSLPYINLSTRKFQRSLSLPTTPISFTYNLPQETQQKDQLYRVQSYWSS